MVPKAFEERMLHVLELRQRHDQTVVAACMYVKAASDAEA